MQSERWPEGVPSFRAMMTLALLASALGAAISGTLKGLQAGLLCGLALSLAPYLLERLLTFLARPEGLPRFLARQIADAVLGLASSIGAALSRVTRPVADVARGPILLITLAAGLLVVVLGACLRALVRPFGAPLGIANLAAAAILAGDVAGLPAASVAVFAGLPAMILMLLVHISETEMVDQPR